MRKSPKFQSYRRKMPHIIPVDSTLVITSRLHGSIPKEIMFQLKEDRQKRIAKIKKEIKEKSYSPMMANLKLADAHKLYDKHFNEILDKAEYGPTWLAQPEIAKITVDALHHFDGERYTLVCHTVMSNHIHFILKDLDRPLADIMKSIKWFSSRESNKVLDRTGSTFWDAESYDHYIRNRNDLINQINYILNNPLEVGLASSIDEWIYNYLHEDYWDLINYSG